MDLSIIDNNKVAGPAEKKGPYKEPFCFAWDARPK